MSNLLAIHVGVDRSAMSRTLVAEFAGQGYGDLKAAVADAVVAFAEPFAARTAETARPTRPSSTGSWPTAPSARARSPRATVTDVFDKVGFLPTAAGQGEARG